MARPWYNVQCAMCSVKCTVFSVQCAVCSVQLTSCPCRVAKAPLKQPMGVLLAATITTSLTILKLADVLILYSVVCSQFCLFCGPFCVFCIQFCSLFCPQLTVVTCGGPGQVVLRAVKHCTCLLCTTLYCTCLNCTTLYCTCTCLSCSVPLCTILYLLALHHCIQLCHTVHLPALYHTVHDCSVSLCTTVYILAMHQTVQHCTPALCLFYGYVGILLYGYVGIPCLFYQGVSPSVPSPQLCSAVPTTVQCTPHKCTPTPQLLAGRLLTADCLHCAVHFMAPLSALRCTLYGTRALRWSVTNSSGEMHSVLLLFVLGNSNFGLNSGKSEGLS